MILEPTPDPDLLVLRQFAMESAERQATFKRVHRGTICLAKAAADIYFWPEQTDDQRAAMKEWLVDVGIATWFVPRAERITI